MAPFVEQLTPPLALPLNAGHTMNNHDHPGPLQYHSAPYYRPPPHHEDVVTPPEYWDQSSVTPTRHQPYATNTEPNRSHVDWTPTLSTAYPPPEQPAAATFPYRGAQMDGPHSAATARRYEHPYRGAQMDGSHSAASTRRYEHKMKRRREKDHTATLNHPQPMSLLNSRPPHKVYSVYRRAKSHVTECYCFLPDYDFCPRHPDVCADYVRERERDPKLPWSLQPETKIKLGSLIGLVKYRKNLNIEELYKQINPLEDEEWIKKRMAYVAEVTKSPRGPTDKADNGVSSSSSQRNHRHCGRILGEALAALGLVVLCRLLCSLLPDFEDKKRFELILYFAAGRALQVAVQRVSAGGGQDPTRAALGGAAVVAVTCVALARY
ncbi:hypothetical protein GGR56DRAFT_671812 [Xylariaceae sp. FL0804]|nr:hypothetical protein GGR56DRAFT_671812 [Xylariaceae sp. FL0804]